MNDARLLERLAWADEYPPTTPLPDDIWTVDAISHEVERRTGMTQTTDHQAPETDQRSGRTRLVLAAAAAFVVVILFGAAMWAFTARQTGGEVIDAPPTTAAVPTTQAAPANPEAAGDIAFIELHVKTWFESGDFELAADQIGSSPREGGGGLASEVLYQAAIDARASVTDCKALDEPRTYQCTVGYSNMLFEALGEPAWLTTMEFGVVADDLLSPIPYDDRYPGKNYVNAAWLEFEREAGLADESSCDEIASNSVSCPELQREHLDAFAAWWTTNG